MEVYALDNNQRNGNERSRMVLIILKVEELDETCNMKWIYLWGTEHGG